MTFYIAIFNLLIVTYTWKFALELAPLTSIFTYMTYTLKWYLHISLKCLIDNFDNGHWQAQAWPSTTFRTQMNTSTDYRRQCYSWRGGCKRISSLAAPPPAVAVDSSAASSSWTNIQAASFTSHTRGQERTHARQKERKDCCRCRVETQTLQFPLWQVQTEGRHISFHNDLHFKMIPTN